MYFTANTQLLKSQRVDYTSLPSTFPALPVWVETAWMHKRKDSKLPDGPHQSPLSFGGVVLAWGR